MQRASVVVRVSRVVKLLGLVLVCMGQAATNHAPQPPGVLLWLQTPSAFDVTTHFRDNNQFDRVTEAHDLEKSSRWRKYVFTRL